MKQFVPVTALYILASLSLVRCCQYHDDIEPYVCVGYNSCNAEVTADNLSHHFASYGELTVNFIRIYSVPLTTLRAGYFGSLNYTSLSILRTDLTSVEDGTFQSSKDAVERIEIVGHLINHFNFKSLHNLPNLKIFYVTHGLISELPSNMFHPNSELEYINFQSNEIIKIHKMAFSNLTNIKTIVLSRNKITTIGEFAFSLPNNLVDVNINLDQNQIQSIDKYAFKDLKFKTLSLKNNKLESLASSVFEQLLVYLVYFRVENGAIDVEGNSFECDETGTLWLVVKPFWHKSRVKNFVCLESKKSLNELLQEELITNRPDYWG